MSSILRRPGPRYAALIQLLRTAENLWNASRVFFDRWDLSPSQFNILNLLRDRRDGCTQSELSRQLIMHRSNVTGLVDRLEQRGLVCRKDSATDRRAWRVALTSQGRRLLEEILPEYYTVAEDIWGSIPAREANQLASGLAVLCQQVEQFSGNARA
jgi:DNA-binding MarR family transcriptional regulator